MWQTKMAKIVGYAIALFGLSVVIGWVFGIDWLKAPLLHMVPMKFLNGFSFMLGGILLVLITKSSINEDPYGIVVLILPIISMMIMLIMVTLIFSLIAGFELGFVNAFIKGTPEATKATYSASQGVVPSWGTMIGFIFIALTGLLEPLTFYRKALYQMLIGAIVMIIGEIALIGYIINAPLLFYYFYGKSSAMAIETALLFVIWGAVMVAFCFRGKNDPNSR